VSEWVSWCARVNVHVRVRVRVEREWMKESEVKFSGRSLTDNPSLHLQGRRKRQQETSFKQVARRAWMVSYLTHCSNPVDGGGMFLRNVRSFSTNYKALYIIQLNSSVLKWCGSVSGGLTWLTEVRNLANRTKRLRVPQRTWNFLFS
jgi:hypothetical protein